MITRFLTRKLPAEPRGVQERGAYGMLAGLVGIACNLLLCALKLLIGLLSGSVSVTADAINNLSDASSSLVNLFGFKLAQRPADSEHPYGYGRYEYLTALTVAVLILALGFEMLKSGIGKIFSPDPVVFSAAGLIALAASIGVKLWMAGFYKTIGQKIDSAALLASAQDSRNDVISTGTVLLSGIVTRLFGLQLDGIVGTAVAAFILYGGVNLVRETIDPLLGVKPSPDLVRMIRDKVLSYPGVLGLHDLMLHDYGPGNQYATVHVEVDAKVDPILSHDLIDGIEQDFMTEEGLHIVIHMDPIAVGDPRVDRLHELLRETAKVCGVSVHDVRIVPLQEKTRAVFDCVVPHAMAAREAEIREQLTRAVTQADPTYECVINMERSFADDPGED